MMMEENKEISIPDFSFFPFRRRKNHSSAFRIPLHDLSWVQSIQQSIELLECTSFLRRQRKEMKKIPHLVIDPCFRVCRCCWKSGVFGGILHPPIYFVEFECEENSWKNVSLRISWEIDPRTILCGGGKNMFWWLIGKNFDLGWLHFSILVRRLFVGLPGTKFYVSQCSVWSGSRKFTFHILILMQMIYASLK